MPKVSGYGFWAYTMTILQQLASIYLHKIAATRNSEFFVASNTNSGFMQNSGTKKAAILGINGYIVFYNGKRVQSRLLIRPCEVLSFRSP